MTEREAILARNTLFFSYLRRPGRPAVKHDAMPFRQGLKKHRARQTLAGPPEARGDEKTGEH